MNQQRKEDITCPHCGKHGKAKIWESINVDLNPELRERIFSGDLFLWECPHCGHQLILPFGFLYHDMRNKFMLFFSFDEEDSEKMYEAVDLQGVQQFLKQEYTIRWVYGYRNLKEKIQVLENHLNDVAIEHMKFMISHVILPEIAQQGYELYTAGVDVDDNVSPYGAIFFAYDDEQNKQYKRIRFAMDNYYEHCKTVEIDPRMQLHDNRCVDQGWMARQLMSFTSPHTGCKNKGCKVVWKEGKCVLVDNVGRALSDYVTDVENGYFTFRGTKHKAKTMPTRYLYGVGHVSGVILFPPMFEHLQWLREDKKDAYYAELDGKPYIITLDGTIYDPERTHLPKRFKINPEKFIEKLMNWVLPGLQFFYIDTDAPVIVEATYHIGDTIRAGRFLDATTKLWRPARKTRFLIASAHTAMLCELPNVDPDFKKWNLCTFHYNSYFKVMDIYTVKGVTQVLLLHIPEAGARFLGNHKLDFAQSSGLNLVELAHQSLDEKMKMEVHPRSLDKRFVERTFHPVGLDEEYNLIPLNPQEEPDDEPTKHLSAAIHKLSNDADIDGFFEVEDNFIWKGAKGTICEECIYSKSIKNTGDGCGRLFQKSFRENYFKGRCEYRKTNLFEPSEFERNKKFEQEKAKDDFEQ